MCVWVWVRVCLMSSFWVVAPVCAPERERRPDSVPRWLPPRWKNYPAGIAPVENFTQSLENIKTYDKQDLDFKVSPTLKVFILLISFNPSVRYAQSMSPCRKVPRVKKYVVTKSYITSNSWGQICHFLCKYNPGFHSRHLRINVAFHALNLRFPKHMNKNLFQP